MLAYWGFTSRIINFFDLSVTALKDNSIDPLICKYLLWILRYRYFYNAEFDEGIIHGKNRRKKDRRRTKKACKKDRR